MTNDRSKPLIDQVRMMAINTNNTAGAKRSPLLAAAANDFFSTHHDLPSRHRFLMRFERRRTLKSARPQIMAFVTVALFVGYSNVHEFYRNVGGPPLDLILPLC